MSTPQGVPWEALSEFCARHPRFDVLMNVSTRSFRMERAHISRGDGAWSAYQLRPFQSFPQWFSRPNWMLTEETRVGGHSWVQLVGRSMTTAEAGYRSLGFYAMSSARGESILDGLETPRDAADAPADEPTLLLDLPGVSPSPSLPRRSGRGDGARELPLFPMPDSQGDRGASRSISTVGDVRRTGESAAGMSRLPLSD